MTIGVCMKWVADAREPDDDRFAGTSPADRAALELALRQASEIGEDVLVVTAGPPAAERALRDALSCGAATVLRIDLDAGTPSAVVAQALAGAVRACSAVWCGDHSLDRGSGSVPAFIAAALDRPQALGVVHVDVDGSSVRAVRRLDGGRREVLSLHGGIVSVEGAAASLRRASLAAALRSRQAPVPVARGGEADHAPPSVTRPYRPRARAFAAPAGASALERVRSLTDAASAPQRGETVTLPPDAAARRILDALHEWGYPVTTGSGTTGSGMSSSSSA